MYWRNGVLFSSNAILFIRISHCLWGPPSLVSNGYKKLFLRWQSSHSVKIVQYFHLVPRSSMWGALHKCLLYTFMVCTVAIVFSLYMRRLQVQWKWKMCIHFIDTRYKLWTLRLYLNVSYRNFKTYRDDWWCMRSEILTTVNIKTEVF
jgi:hypothetical protein